jgi:hypothetical protein
MVHLAGIARRESSSACEIDDELRANPKFARRQNEDSGRKLEKSTIFDFERRNDTDDTDENYNTIVTTMAFRTDATTQPAVSEGIPARLPLSKPASSVQARLPVRHSR